MNFLGIKGKESKNRAGKRKDTITMADILTNVIITSAVCRGGHVILEKT